jgi:hypothetical protein
MAETLPFIPKEAQEFPAGARCVAAGAKRQISAIFTLGSLGVSGSLSRGRRAPGRSYPQVIHGLSTREFGEFEHSPILWLIIKYRFVHFV